MQQQKIKHMWNAFILKGLGGEGEGVNLTHPSNFYRNISSRKRVKPCFFVIFNLIISPIFPGNFI